MDSTTVTSQQIPDSVNSSKIQEILDLLRKGEENIKYGEHKNVILILGNTGSGKSTFTQYIAGNNDNLISEETEEGGEFLIIDNNNKISSKSITSQTIYPELVIDTNTNTEFYDCPGFSDTRSAAHDISTTYFIKKIIDSSYSLKLVFTISYPSVRSGVNRHDFMILLTHAVSMIKNITKFQNNIALIVTKVDNRVVEQDGIYHLVPDNKIINGVASFLKQVKNELKEKISLINISNDQQFYKNAVKFINILLHNNDKTYTRIGISRRPNKSGVLSKITLLQNGKNSLRKILHENIQFTMHDEEDFGYTISPDSQNYVHGLVDKINKNIASDVANIGKEIEKYYNTQEKQSHDIQEIYDKIDSAYHTLLATKKAATKFIEPQDLIKQITKNIQDLNISVSSKNLLSVINYTHYLKFIKYTSNQITVKQLEWAHALTDIVEYLNNSQKWYSFLINLYTILSKYDIQQDINQYANITNDLKHQIVSNGYQAELNTGSLQEFLDKVRINKEYNKIKNIKLDNVKLRFLIDLINMTLKYNVDLLCDNQTQKLVIRGQYVKLSDITNINCPQPKLIEIFALNKVFIDSNLNRTDDQVQLSIIAPTWDIIGNHQIILDGRPGEGQKLSTARNGIGPESDGKYGNPGKPGGSASNFLGIGQNFINGQHLSISANGGKGGPGQHGGAGGNGKDGDKPPVPDSSGNPRDLWNEYTVKSKRRLVVPATPGSEYTNYETRFKIYGKQCSDGRNGGNGGVGGEGGNPGNVTMISLNRNSNILIINNKGNTGINGTGGNGGMPGTAGQVLIVDSYIAKSYYLTLYRNKVKSQNDLPHCISGKPGIAGHNAMSIENPKTTVTLSTTSILNGYKNYLRENLSSSIRESSLRKFLNQLENHKSAIDLYDTLSFINELRGLENQFHTLRKELTFLPFYESLLYRIRRYAKKVYDDGENTKECTKVLSYLYTAILGRICTSKNNVSNNLVIDLQGYLDLVVNDINKLKELSDEVSAEKYKKNYEDVIINKTKEAVYFIDTQITPEINNILIEIDQSLELLIDETIALQNAGKKEKRKLIDQRHTLENALVLRKLLGVMKITSQFLSFVGPLGAAAGALIGGESMVVESLSLDDMSAENTGKLVALPNAVKTSVTKITDELKNKQQLFKEQLHDAAQNLDKFLEKQPSSNLEEIRNKISVTKVMLDQEIAKELVMSPESVDNIYSMRKKLIELLENQKEILEKQKPETDIIIDRQLRMVNHLQHMVYTVEISIDLYGKIKNDKAKINQLGHAIKQADDKITKLLQYEQDIYKTIIPTFTGIESNVATIKNNLQGKSHFALDVKKWQIQSTLKDLKHYMQKMTKGFNVQEDLMHSIDKLEEGMSIMINIYNRIEDYQGKAELAAYIANINSNKAMDIVIEKEEFRNAIVDLRLVIQSNLILENYEIAMNAFRQSIFPFADFYLAEFNFLYSLKSTDTVSLASQAIRKIEELKSKVSKSTVTIDKYDKYIHNKKLFNSDNIQTSPFFVWKNDMNKHTISKLLEGEEITIKSDITRGLTKNGIKFNEIGIHFKSADELIQHELDKQLKDFEVTMIHLGISYYRCDDKFYTITSDNQTISYSFGKDNYGELLNTNLVYDKIRSSNPVLSPYTIWTIKLTNSNDNFSALAKYKSQAIDLELVGRGQYVDQGIDVCNDNLKKYYTLDDTISEINNIDVYKQQNLQEIVSEITTDVVSYDHSNNHRRRRRDVEKNNLIRDINESSFATSGSCSNIKPSFINTIFNLVGDRLKVFKYLNTASQISQWFNKKQKNIDQNLLNRLHNDTSKDVNLLNNISLPTELPEISNKSINHNASTVNNVLNNSSFYNNGNLLLLDLLVRLKSGVKYKHEGIVANNEPDYRYALNLAYREHVPKDRLSSVSNNIK